MSDNQKLAGELMQFEAELLEAEQRHDVLALDQLLDESFVLVTTKGNRLPKQAFLAFLEDARMLSFELLNMEVREIAPGLALLVADLLVDMTVKNEVIPRHLTLSTIWKRSDDGTWTAVFRQNAAMR
jgi:hypothetical protein